MPRPPDAPQETAKDEMVTETGSPMREWHPIAPVKPSYGQPCNGCGHCCEKEICGLGLEILDGGADDATPLGTPYPFLVYHHGRSWCGVIEAAQAKDIAFAEYLGWKLGIGTFCQMADPPSSADPAKE